MQGTNSVCSILGGLRRTLPPDLWVSGLAHSGKAHGMQWEQGRGGWVL